MQELVGDNITEDDDTPLTKLLSNYFGKLRHLN